MGQAYSTQRQEAFDRHRPDFPKLTGTHEDYFGDIWLRNGDFPGAREMADRLKRAVPPELTGEKPIVPPEMQQQMQQMQAQMQEMGKELEQKNMIIQTKQVETASAQSIKSMETASKERIEAVKAELESAKIITKAMEAELKHLSTLELEEVKTQLSMVQQGIDRLRQPDEPTQATGNRTCERRTINGGIMAETTGQESGERRGNRNP